MESSGIRYVVHAYAWTSSWSNDDLRLINHVVELGLDGIEIPLMELELIDPEAIRARCESAGAAVVTSTAVDEERDPSSESTEVRERARRYLCECVEAAAAMGAPILTGVTYSALGRRLERPPNRADLERAADVLRDVARFAADRDVTVGIEPVNRYETFLVNTAAQGRELKQIVGEPNVGVHLDAYHMNIEEESFGPPVTDTIGDLIHFHLSESHRGIPGTGTVDWEAIMGALAGGRYAGYVGLESFAEMSDAMRAATCVWRQLAPDSDTLVRDGVEHLKGLERRFAAS
jgi:D-psicose/D-tagatose/L-ribulose 3-epimerase